jgi:HD-GYP domain-containing protein (c-di-GMP phosphodiesterase class II)
MSDLRNREKADSNSDVAPQDLRLGGCLSEDIYIERPGQEPMLLYAKGLVISTYRQLERLKEASPKRMQAADVPRRMTFQADTHCSEEQVESFQELRISVDEMKSWDIDASASVNGVFSDVGRGAEPDTGALVDMAEDFRQSYQKNPELALLLSGMRAVYPYLYAHSCNVASLLQVLLKQRGSSDEACRRAFLAAMLHDIGMIQMLDTVEVQTIEQSEEYSLHPDFSAELVRNLHGISSDVHRAISEHHERYSGQGFSQGLRGDAIHPLAQELGLCDAFESLTAPRAYREALPVKVAMNLLRSWANRDFSASLIADFTKAFGEWTVGMPVALTNGERGRVALLTKQMETLLVAVRRDDELYLVDVKNQDVSIQKGLKDKDVDVHPQELF